MCYWLKVVAAAVGLSALLVAAIGGIAFGVSRLPEPVQTWVAGGGIFAVLVTAMASGIHLWLRVGKKLAGEA